MEYFSTREIATFIWLVAFLLFALKSDSVGKSMLGVLRSVFQVNLLILLEAMAIYLMIACFVLSFFIDWGIGEIKMAIFWYFFTGLALLGKTVSNNGEFDGYKSWVRSTFTLLIFTEFLISKYTFSLLGELLFVPFMTLLVGMSTVAEFQEEHKDTKKFIDWAIAAIGLNLLAFTVYKFLSDETIFQGYSTVIDLTLPIFFSLWMLPFYFGVFIFVNYENAFSRLRYAFPDKNLRKRAKRIAWSEFKCNVKALKRWVHDMQMTRPLTEEEIRASTGSALEMTVLQKTPPTVPKEQGWSPFLAQDYLASYSPNMSDYRKSSDSWYSEGIIKRERRFSQNLIFYSLEGQKTFADLLKLKLTIQDLSKKEHDIAFYMGCLEDLLMVAAPEIDFDKVTKMAKGDENCNDTIDGYVISYRKEVIEIKDYISEEYLITLQPL